MIEIGEHPEGCILRVRAQPRARRAGIQGEHGGALKVAVTAPPDRGQANRALIEVLREVLGLRGGQIELLSGHTNRDKRFLIRGTPPAELGAKIGQLLKESGVNLSS